MTRTNTILGLVLAMTAAAVVAAPAAASDGYRSVDSIVAGAGAQSATPSGDVSSAKPLLAGSSDRPSAPIGGSAYRSPDSIVATADPRQPSAAPSGGRGYVDAFVREGGSRLHPATASPVSVVEVRSGDGFHWLDALIGALIASGLLLIGVAAARSVVRHRRITAESRA
ncbi:MAG TPA: hypothetical protein VK919_06510 [Solirubrobacterales bacterium]|nr:hypothetical protein [Solirubrobacterales bacterium]